MAKNQVRNRVAAATTAVAAAALLAGPALTWGLDVAGVSTDSTTTQVTSTVQGTTTTVQQTTSTAVSTVQQTVQTVEQTASAPVQQAVQTVQQTASAPVQTVTAPSRTSAPSSSARTAPKAAVQRATSVVKRTTGSLAAAKPAVAASSAATTVDRTAARVQRAATKRAGGHSLKAAATGSATKGSALLPCDQIATLIPAVPGLDGLLATLCDAVNVSLPGGRMGTSPAATTQLPDSPLLGMIKVLAARASGFTPVHGHAATLRHTVLPTGKRPNGPDSAAGASAANAGAPGALLGAARGGGGPVSGAPAAAAGGPGAYGTSSGTAAKHLGLFGTDVTGTKALSLVLMIDIAVLAALLMWGAARRWVIPRFA